MVVPSPQHSRVNQGRKIKVSLFPLILPEKSRVFLRWRDGDEVVQLGNLLCPVQYVVRAVPATL